jgi:hypothetical protein
MKEKLLAIANEMKGLSAGVETQAVNLYIFYLQRKKMDTMRTMADSLHDYYRKVNDHSERLEKLVKLSVDLYDNTMLYYELNTTF